jgi:phosphoglycolate phosphatase
MIRTVLFDFDGTLTPLTLDFGFLKSEIEALVRRFAGDHALQGLEGHYIIEMIHAVADDMGTDGETFRRLAFEKLTSLELEAARGKGLYPCAREVLTALKARGIAMGIMTRTSIAVIEAVFPDAFVHMDAVVTREDTRHVKPDPRHVLKALEIMGARAVETLVVGDHPTDIAGGRSAGTLTAGVLSGRTGREAFEEAGATFILDDVRGILAIG